MSRENVVLFVKAAEKKSELNEQLANKQNTADWVKIADAAGFEFTEDEFCSVVEETIHKKVTPENAVQEYLSAAQSAGSGEINQQALQAVVGGMAVRYIKMEPLFIQVAKPPTREM